jgi:hypothetical protein
MQESSGRDRQNGRERVLNTRLNARVVVTLLLAFAVVFAGCTGIGGLVGDSGGDDAGDGVVEANTPSGDGADSADANESDGDSAGDNADDSADGSSASTALDTEDDWFNLSKPGRYVFEIESAEEGVGTMVFETTEVTKGQATVSVEYDLGEESFESTVTGPVGEVKPQIATSPAYAYLIAIQLGGIGAGALSGGEQLEVGNEFSQQSAEGSLHIEVTGTDSYAGVDCYVIETRVNETLSQELCIQQAFSSAPYIAIYDENGDLDQRIELVEYESK